MSWGLLVPSDEECECDEIEDDEGKIKEDKIEGREDDDLDEEVIDDDSGSPGRCIGLDRDNSNGYDRRGDSYVVDRLGGAPCCHRSGFWSWTGLITCTTRQHHSTTVESRQSHSKKRDELWRRTCADGDAAQSTSTEVFVVGASSAMEAET